MEFAISYDERYKKWRYEELPILPQTWKYAPTPGKEKQLAILKELLHRSDVSEVVNGCDAGREGELIFRFVYEQAGCTKPFSRLWISSMEDSAIREGFAGRRAGTEYDALYQSALCRARADWLVGINATRLFSVLYHKTLNVGRVLSPNRLQVFFDGKPDEAARDELKANGFRWAPSVGAWQRQLNKNAYYAAGYISCIQPISGEKPIDVQRSTQQQESAAPDTHLTGERVSTPRGSFHVANMTREQMEAAGYGYHHSTDDGKYLIMGNGTQAFAIAAEQREQENYMRTAELSTEQNYNMIDGQINNTPSVDELEEKAKRGEVISLSALAAAVKAEDGRTPQRDPDGKKPSIRAQLKADRAQSCKPQQREKEQEAKRSIRQALEME